jgi:hypothetical protein
MQLSLVLSQEINRGAFATLFEISPDAVVKLFRKKHLGNLDRPHDPNVAECIVRAVWDCECTAYEILKSYPLERPLVDHCLNRVRVTDVIDSNGRSIANDYHLDCGYSMSRIDGRPIKWRDLANTALSHQAAEIKCRWSSLGILHLSDAGVLGDTSINSIIDFATANMFEELEQYWHEHGVLPPVAIQAWGVQMRD